MKGSSILGAVGFYGAMIAFIYYGERYAKVMLLVWLAISLYCWHRAKQDDDFLDRLPPLLQGVAVFASASFFLTCLGVVLGFLLMMLGIGRR
jgi:hypothetical protein